MMRSKLFIFLCKGIAVLGNGNHGFISRVFTQVSHRTLIVLYFELDYKKA